MGQVYLEELLRLRYRLLSHLHHPTPDNVATWNAKPRPTVVRIL